MLAVMVTSAGFLAVTQKAFVAGQLQHLCKEDLGQFMFVLLCCALSQAESPSAVSVFDLFETQGAQ